MRRKTNRILAIDPGSREMGLAVMKNEELYYYAVKNLKEYRPESVLKKGVREYLGQLIDDFIIEEVVVENGWFSQEKSPLFRAVFKTIEEVAGHKKVPYYTYAPKTIRKFVCGDGKATKRRAAVALAKRYPELQMYLTQDYRYKEKYWLNVYDAVGVGVTHIAQSIAK